jgi:hypothetical protein
MTLHASDAYAVPEKTKDGQFHVRDRAASYQAYWFLEG